eukprot:TRINITY_DN3830_c0_g1_i1.p1 TRINITY_DN3830_c0_g1~~TRINITY_DN3830_c0_g1_i1.p1  ORF type:complete len:443 (-),score=102.81 TRINITY_DN3830_c0_g1_i1:327-1655(-)
MKALILVGGFGTRLRPLTFTMPKPLVPFCNVPMIVHQLVALKAVGVTTVVLAVAYQPAVMEAAISAWADRIGLKVVYSIENTPLGTGGPIALAAEHLCPPDAPADEPFFVLNSDVNAADFMLRDLLEYHRANKAEGTIAVTKVTDPSRFGVVVYEDDGSGLGRGRVDRFVEKPQTFVGDRINAGLYCLSPAVLAHIPVSTSTTVTGAGAGGGTTTRQMVVTPTSIERVVFPAVAAAKKLFAVTLTGPFWMDLGTPRDFVDGTAPFLAWVATVAPSPTAPPAACQNGEVVKPGADAAACMEAVLRLGRSRLLTPTTGRDGGDAPAYEVIGRVLISESATIAPGAVVGPDVAIGAGVRIGPCARVMNSVLLDKSTVGAGAYVSSSVLGAGVNVGRWARVEHRSVVGEGVAVREAVTLWHAHVAPHIGVSNPLRGTEAEAKVVNC